MHLTDLGATLAKLGRAREALPYLEEALKIRRERAEADLRDWRASSVLAAGHFQYGRALPQRG